MIKDECALNLPFVFTLADTGYQIKFDKKNQKLRKSVNEANKTAYQCTTSAFVGTLYGRLVGKKTFL